MPMADRPGQIVQRFFVANDPFPEQRHDSIEVEIVWKPQEWIGRERKFEDTESAFDF